MTSRQLEIFLRLSRNLNFAKTANEMYMTQSTISREIQLLEKELGFSLFDRNPKYVKLTSKGKQLSISLLPLLNSIKNTLSNIKQSKSCYSSCLRIGFYHRASILKIPEVLKEFHKMFPNVQPELHQGNLNQLNTLFASEHLDIVFGMKNAFTPSKNSQIQELYKGYLCVSLPTCHPLAAQTELSFADLNGYDILILDRSSVQAELSYITNLIKEKCPDSQFFYCSNVEEQEVYLSAGIGVTISVQYSFIPNKQFIQIPFVDSSVNSNPNDLNYAVMWRKTIADNHVEEFVRMAIAKYQTT